MMIRTFGLALLVASVTSSLAAQQPERVVYTRHDTLRGSDGPARSWWDARFYDLHVKVSPVDSTISGYNAITYSVLSGSRDSTDGRPMQIDLQVPMQIDSVIQDGRGLRFRRDSNAYFVNMASGQAEGTRRTLRVYFHGRPRVATRPPWDGGFIWREDSLGFPHIATANEGLGASVWWPNKDFGADEPDSQRVAITVPDSMVNVSNGRLRSVTRDAANPGYSTWEWFVSNPINNYNVAVNAGRYAHFTGYYVGERGMLTMDFYPLAIHEDTARVQFQQAIPTLQCFERWFGPFPWYDDGFKLVETPHLGMEHQSAVAYGNRYKNGYLGRDLSRTGWGLKWDFIIVHETAHEWWGNNISMRDHADMWIHESFANYSEALYTECLFGKQAGAEYVIGSRVGIRNDAPIIPVYGVNAEGSGDMYPKGGNMLHTIRQIVGDDEKWRAILRGANTTFWHKTITGRQLQTYMSRAAAIDFSKVFEQYLTTTKIPVLEYRVEKDSLFYRWANVVPGFDMPLHVAFPAAPTSFRRIQPATTWAAIPTTMGATDKLVVKPDFYVTSTNVVSRR